MGSKKRIGIFGGTFDPPHLGHLVAAESVREEHNLDEVIFVPSGGPPHKSAGGVSSARHRFLMTALATVGNSAFSTSRIELDRPPPSFTVDTLRQLRAERGDATDLHFIIGADALLELRTWKSPDEVLRLCRMVAVTRPGFALSSIPERLGELFEHHADRILVTQIPALDVSASEVRRRIQTGRSIRYLVPDMVREYIEAHQLYQGSQERR